MEEYSFMPSLDRHKAAAGMLRRRFAQNSGAGPAGADGDCPEPEILAAYCERSLDAEETARYELHFSRCARCREQIAVMTRAGEILAADEEKSQLASSSPWLWNWKWLAPVAAVLILAAVWAARRPASPKIFAISQEELDSHEITPRTSAPAGAAPAGAARAPNTPALRMAPNLSLDKAQKTVSRQSAIPTEPANNEVADNLSTNSVEDEESKPLSKSANKPRRDIEERAVATQSGPPSPAALPPPEPPASLARVAGAPMSSAADAMAQVETDASSQDLKAKQLAAPAKTSRYDAEDKRATGILIRTPDSQYLWRIRAAGFVERSNDGGATWHGELPNPNAHLLAGSAPSAQTCWVVGNGGVIFLTQDGSIWTTISPPVTADFVAVAAKDASSATVTAADGRKFATSDAGKHWTPVQ
jgi:hypothetical protein